MNATPPSIALVICTTGAADRISALTDRLAAVSARCGSEVEIVVVDNSSAGTVVLPRPIRVLRCALPGLSRARTLGCLATEARIFVLTDDDVEFGDDWPLRMARPIRSGEADAVGAPVRLGDEFDHVSSSLERAWLAEANLTGGARLVGAGMAFDRELLSVAQFDQRIGAGSREYPFGEESLFESMVREAGGRVAVAADAPVIHHPNPARASRDAFHSTATAKGMSEAYAAYHWHDESLAFPRLRAARRTIRLAWERRRGIEPERELNLLRDIGFARGFANESRHARAYVPRLSTTYRPTGLTPATNQET